MSTGRSPRACRNSREQAQAVEPRQEQIEDHELIRAVERKSKADGAVLGGVHDEALSLESQSQEVEDPGLILDHENAHGRRRPYNAAPARAARYAAMRSRTCTGSADSSATRVALCRRSACTAWIRKCTSA